MLATPAAISKQPFKSIAKFDGKGKRKAIGNNSEKGPLNLLLVVDLAVVLEATAN